MTSTIISFFPSFPPTTRWFQSVEINVVEQRDLRLQQEHRRRRRQLDVDRESDFFANGFDCPPLLYQQVVDAGSLIPVIKMGN